MSGPCRYWQDGARRAAQDKGSAHAHNKWSCQHLARVLELGEDFVVSRRWEFCQKDHGLCGMISFNRMCMNEVQATLRQDYGMALCTRVVLKICDRPVYVLDPELQGGEKPATIRASESYYGQ
jgi:hypothetical protein